MPTITDVLLARNLLAGRLPPTPAWSYPMLDATAGTRVVVKHENVQPTGAFKVRGGLNLLANMSARERADGVLGYSTGNHAQSLAYAAREFGAPCVIVMPSSANPVKAEAVRALGAELVEHGRDFDQARIHAVELAADRGMRLVSAADEPAIIAGVATVYLELLSAVPDLDVIVVPVGSGSGAAGACLVAAALAPACQVIAVQSEKSPAAHDSWRAGRLVQRPNKSRVDGLATGGGFALPQSILAEHLTDFVLVTDESIAEAQHVLHTRAHTLSEGAGAAALAAVLVDRDRFAGRKAAVVCTGANATDAGR